MTVRDLLWNLVLMHNIHHRGQLVLMCRLAAARRSVSSGHTRADGCDEGGCGGGAREW